jgi:phage terminase small subunit
LKLLRGTARKDRLNPHEPKLDSAADDFDIPPRELDDDLVAIAEWTRVVPVLRKVGLVSALERSVLIALCQQWSRYLANRANPDSPAADTALKHCLKLWLELGFTPSGRTKMIALVKPEAPASKWAGML